MCTSRKAKFLLWKRAINFSSLHKSWALKKLSPSIILAYIFLSKFCILSKYLKFLVGNDVLPSILPIKISAKCWDVSLVCLNEGVDSLKSVANLLTNYFVINKLSSNIDKTVVITLLDMVTRVLSLSVLILYLIINWFQV